jgi:tellurite resistance protein
MFNVFLGILVVGLAVGALAMTGVFGDFGSRDRSSRGRRQSESSMPKVGGLHCRVLLTRAKKDTRIKETLGIEICGRVRAPEDVDKAHVRISLCDITNGQSKSVPVYSRLKQGREGEASDFVYEATLGKLPSNEMVLSDWMTVATIEADWLSFANKGQRVLRLNVAVVSDNGDAIIGSAQSDFNYENKTVGYLELEGNIQRAKMLAVTLAFAVSAADDKLYDCEVEVIKDWARSNIETEQDSERVRAKIEKALDKTVEFFRGGNQVEIDNICRQIVETTPVAERYDILELCLRVVEANGTASSQEVELIWQLGEWLKVDPERFRSMMEKILPVGMYEEEDAESILGLSSDMDPQEAKKRLNDEYRKWNARVTSPEADVREQAEQMLKLIAEARKQYLVEQT